MTVDRVALEHLKTPSDVVAMGILQFCEIVSIVN